MLRQFDEGLSELRNRSRNSSFVPQWIAEWIVPEWSLVLISALIQLWGIFSDHFVGKSKTDYICMQGDLTVCLTGNEGKLSNS